jgi:hypothetical protein
MSQATPAVESEELLERMGYEPELNRELKSSDLVVFLMPRRGRYWTHTD